MANNYLASFVMLLLITSSIALVSAEPSYTFKQNEVVNYRFRCFDASNEYCSDTTILVISVEYPNGSNALDNFTMTHNPTFYNVSLPTDTLGEHDCIISSPTVNGTVSEFAYTVTSTGENFDLPQSVILLGQFALIALFFGFGLSVKKEKWKVKTFFNIMALLMGIVLLNSIRILIGTSTGLAKMGSMGLILGIVVLLFMVLYLFIYALIEVFFYFKKKNRERWSVGDDPL